MKLSYDDHDQVTVLTVSGELTHDQADSFRRTCTDRMQSGVQDFVIDMEYLDLLDSTGLEMLLWLTDELSGRAGQLRLVSPGETVRKILEVTRLERRFDIHDSIESAAKSLRS